MLKRKSLVLIVLFVLLAALSAVVFTNLKTIENSLFGTAYAPSSLCTDDDGTLYVVNSSKKSLLAFDTSARVMGEYAIKNSKDTYIETICTAQESDSVYFTTSTTSMGTMISEEAIYQWDPLANKLAKVFSVTYDRTAAPFQYGNIKCLRVIAGQLYFAKLEAGGTIKVYRLDGEFLTERISEYKTPEHVSQITLLASAGELAYTTREGNVYRSSVEGTELLYQSSQAVESDFISIPWMLAADDADRIYCSDIGRRQIICLPDGAIIENPSGQILYALGVGNGEIFATDYSDIYISQNGKPLELDTRTFHYSLSTQTWHIFLYFSMLAAAVIFLYLAFLMVRQVFRKIQKETTKRLLLCSVTSVLIASFISLLSGVNLLENEKNAMLQTLQSTGFSMQRFVRDQLSEFTAIDALSDIHSAPYNQLKQILDTQIEASYFADANGNNPMYYILYKNVEGTVCSIMDYEDSMCAIHPLESYAGSDYEQVFISGQASELINYQGVYGKWQYMLFPISDRIFDGQTTAETSSVMGYLEVGISTDSLSAMLRTLVIKLVLEIAFFTVLFLMILIEGFKASTTVGAFKRTEGRLAQDASGELLGFIRLITLLVFLSDSLQESFFAAAASQIPVSFFHLSSELTGAIPISVELFTGAVFSVFSGKLLGKHTIRQVLRIGFITETAGLFICAVTISGYYPLLIVGKALIGAGMGICIASANVCASSIQDESKKTSAFAELNAGILAGATIGFASGSYIAALAGYQAVYLTGVVILVIGSAAVTRFVPDFQIRVSHERISSLRFVLNRRVSGFLVFALLPFLVVINFREYFFIIYASQNGITEDRVGQLFLLCGLVIIYLGPFLSKKVTRLVGDRVMVFLAAGVFMAALLIFALIPDVISAIAGVVLVSLGISFGYTAQSNYYTKLQVIRNTDSANSMGMYLLFDNLGQTIGPIVFGAVMTLGNQRSILFIFIGLAVMTGIFALSTITKRGRAYGYRKD